MTTAIRKRCPIGGCTGRIHSPSFLCPHHWYQVPAADRQRIWELYRTQRGSAAHRAAVLQAIVHVQRLAQEPPHDTPA